MLKVQDKIQQVQEKKEHLIRYLNVTHLITNILLYKQYKLINQYSIMSTEPPIIDK